MSSDGVVPSPGKGDALAIVGRIGVVGDVHGRVDLLSRAISAVLRSSPDVTLCLGDVAGTPTATAECCRILEANGVITVKGNHDIWLVDAADGSDELTAQVGRETVEYLRRLPRFVYLEKDGARVFASHGVGPNELGHYPTTFLEPFVKRLFRLGQLPNDCRILLHGHSHTQSIRECMGVTIVSVGALNESGHGGCAYVDAATHEVRWCEY